MSYLETTLIDLKDNQVKISLECASGACYSGIILHVDSEWIELQRSIVRKREDKTIKLQNKRLIRIEDICCISYDFDIVSDVITELNSLLIDKTNEK